MEHTNTTSSLYFDRTIDDLKSFAGVKVLHEIVQKREYQDKKWGGPENDDNQTEKDWIADISDYTVGNCPAQHKDFRSRMIDVAALAVAAIQSHDRKAAKEAESETV